MLHLKGRRSLGSIRTRIRHTEDVTRVIAFLSIVIPFVKCDVKFTNKRYLGGKCDVFN